LLHFAVFLFAVAAASGGRLRGLGRLAKNIQARLHIDLNNVFIANCSSVEPIWTDTESVHGVASALGTSSHIGRQVLK
jgi:hypothetical protein